MLACAMDSEERTEAIATDKTILVDLFTIALLLIDSWLVGRRVTREGRSG
jgi:hypothetical protein